MALVNDPGTLTNALSPVWNVTTPVLASNYGTFVQLGDGRIFSICGLTPLSEFDNKAWIFHEDGTNWVECAPPPFVRPVTPDVDPNGGPGVISYTNSFFSMYAARLENGKIACWGGVFQRPSGDILLDPLGQAFIYDPVTDTWEKCLVPDINKITGIPVFAFGAEAPHAAAVKGNQVLIPECFDPDQLFPLGAWPTPNVSYAIIDFPSGFWQKFAYPVGVSSMSWTRLTDGRVFMVGGFDSATGLIPQGHAWIIDFDGTCTQLPPLPAGEERGSPFVVQLPSGDVFVYGGAQGTQPYTAATTCWRYSFTNNAWESAEAYPDPGGQWAAGYSYFPPEVFLTANGSALAFGGQLNPDNHHPHQYNEIVDKAGGPGKAWTNVMPNLPNGPNFNTNTNTGFIVRNIYGRLVNMTSYLGGTDADGFQSLDDINYCIPHYIQVGGAPYTPAEVWINFIGDANLANARTWVRRSPFSVGIVIEGLDDGAGGYFSVPIDVFISAKHPEES